MENADKVEALPDLKKTEIQKVAVNNSSFVEATRHLGGMCTYRRTNMHDINKRLKAMRSAWPTMCGWWFSSNEKSLRRMVFRCINIGMAVSGLTTYVLLPSELKKLDTCILKQLRGMLQGKATKESLIHKEAINNKEMWD